MKACLTSRWAGPQPSQGSGECHRSPRPVLPPSWPLRSETGAQPHWPGPSRLRTGPQLQARTASGWPGRRGPRLWALGRHESVTGALHWVKTRAPAGVLPGSLSLILGRGASRARRILSSARCGHHSCPLWPCWGRPAPRTLGTAGQMCKGARERGSRKGPGEGSVWRSVHGNGPPGHTAFGLDASGKPRLVGRGAPTQHPHLLPGS